MTTVHDPADDLERRLGRLGPALDGPAGPRTNGAGPDPVSTLVAGALARAEADGLVDVAWAVEDSPIGPLTLAATPEGLVKIAFGGEDGVLAELAARVSPRVVHLPRRLDAVRRELDQYFAGERRDFDVALDRRLSRGYRLEVLEELSLVPYGHTVTYKDLADRTGHPGASRAVGTAMATNPIPVVVPCHRVLRTGGALGGYGGGLDAKVWLLRHEGAVLG